MTLPQEPRFVRRESFEVVGIEERTPHPEKSFPGLWEVFGERQDDILHREDLDVAYGLCIMGGKKEGSGNEHEDFTTFVGAEVSNASDIPEGMVTRALPAADYAVFLHKGAFFPDGLPKTYDYIYREWFPKSVYKPSDNYNFEHYDRRFCGVDNPNTIIEIWVPVKKEVA